MRRLPLLVLILALSSAGCTPSLSPLYRDFSPAPLADEAPAADGLAEPPPTSPLSDGELMDRTAQALEQAGWTPEPGAAGAKVLRTGPRTVGNVGLYRTEVTLEAVPLNGGFVRVYFHPYRHYLIGGRSKLPYLNPGLQRALLPALEDAFQAEGLELLGTARKRDEANT